MAIFTGTFLSSRKDCYTKVQLLMIHACKNVHSWILPNIITWCDHWLLLTFRFWTLVFIFTIVNRIQSLPHRQSISSIQVTEIEPFSLLVTNVNIKLRLRFSWTFIRIHYIWVKNVHVRNVITWQHRRDILPHIISQYTHVRNIYMRNVITKLHLRSVSPLISSLST